MGPARPTPDFGFWILDFGFRTRTPGYLDPGLRSRPSAIQNPKSKIQNAVGWVPDSTGPGTRRRLPRAPLGSDDKSAQTSPDSQRRPPNRPAVRPWPAPPAPRA